LLAVPIAAPGAQLSADGPWVVRVAFESREQVRALAEWADVWAVYPEKGYLLVLADAVDLDQLRAEGYVVEVDAVRSAALQQIGVPLALQTTGIPGYPCYRTVEETYATAEQIVADHPDLASWIDIGDSWEKIQNPANGYDLKVLVLTQSAVPGPKPKLFTHYAIHAREYTTAELGTRFAELLVSKYGTDPDITWLLDHHEIHLLLMTNPDGRKMAETGLSWRKNTNNNYCSNTTSRGADLNRNFEFQWGCCGGSSSFECSTTYRGPSPASEPEIQALEAYVRSIFPDQRAPELTAAAPDDATGVAIDIHSHGRLVLWPWGFTATPAGNGTQLRTLGRKLAYFNGHTPQAGIELYVTDGSSNDFYYGDLGVAAYVFELGTAFFESCNYFELNILEQNLEALLLAAKVARTPYLTPAGPEALAPALLPRAFTAGEPALLTVTLDDTRYSSLNGTEPSQAIAAAEAYADLPPWEAGAVPVALSASDGTFDAPVETAEVSLDTTGLALGRHTVYVRGQDAAGNWGPVSAVFLWMIDPATAPTLQGTVRDADTAAPLAGATVSTGAFEAVADAGGVYSLRLPAGTYDLTASAAGYQAATIENVTAADLQTLTRDFDLLPFTGVLADDAEGGNVGWTAQAPWALTAEASYSPTHAWSDSPGSLYANNANTALTSPALDLTGLAGVSLTFRHLYDLEAGFDFARVEISADGGQSWSEAAVWSGSSGGWKAAEIALPMLDGVADGRVRFRLESDESVQKNGWWLDDILVRGLAAPPCTGDADCDDGVACTVDTCDLAAGECNHLPDDAFCDNGLFCDGTETCDAALDCRPGTDPCGGGVCDEVGDVCTTVCGDGLCEAGEDCVSCAADCPSLPLPGAACGNGLCEAGDGEDCVTCPADCVGVQTGGPSGRFCCGFGGVNPVGCADARCISGGYDCTETPVGSGGTTCCGDLVCESPEDGFTCELDCGAPPACGDGTCDPGEDACSCSADCGLPPASETGLCTDGLDNDCDLAADCADADCAGDPACQAVDCSQYGDKKLCNEQPGCVWDNATKMCLPV
jgi:hypothetical protein